MMGPDLHHALPTAVNRPMGYAVDRLNFVASCVRICSRRVSSSLALQAVQGMVSDLKDYRLLLLLLPSHSYAFSTSPPKKMRH